MWPLAEALVGGLVWALVRALVGTFLGTFIVVELFRVIDVESVEIGSVISFEEVNTGIAEKVPTQCSILVSRLFVVIKPLSDSPFQSSFMMTLIEEFPVGSLSLFTIDIL